MYVGVRVCVLATADRNLIKRNRQNVALWRIKTCLILLESSTKKSLLLSAIVPVVFGDFSQPFTK
jgi:hypothetical protein